MSFREEIAWFEKNQARLKKKYPGKVAVVYQQKLQGVFVDNLAALKFRTANWPRGVEILIRPVDYVPGVNIIAPNLM